MWGSAQGSSYGPHQYDFTNYYGYKFIIKIVNMLILLLRQVGVFFFVVENDAQIKAQEYKNSSKTQA